MTSQTQDLVITNTSSIPPSNVISFGYIKKEDVKVELGTTESNRVPKNYDVEWTITSDNKVQLASSVFSTTGTGTYKLKIYRQTDATSLAHTFQVGSSIKAEDLNNSNKQVLYLSEENRDNLNSLASGDSVGALSINGSHIADRSITSDKLADPAVNTVDIIDDAVTADKLANSINSAIAANTAKVTNATHTGDVTGSTTLTISDNAVTTSKIQDGQVTQAKINSALLAALQTHFSTPVATVIWYAGVGGAGTPPPTGYLKANGDSIPNGTGTVQGVTADFSALYALVGATLPDLRGEFIRGWDDGKGVDSNRSFKSTQSDQWKNHQHVFGGDDMIASSSIGNFTSIGASGHFAYDATSTPSGNGRSMYTKNSNIDSGGTETRPRNVALLACIKY